MIISRTQLDDVRKENGKLSNDNQRLQETSDRYDRVVRILGTETVEDVVQQDIKEQKDTGRKTANGANAKGKRSETVGMGNSKEPD